MRIKKESMRIGLFILFTVQFLYNFSSLQAQADPPRIKVGVSITLTGEAATFGEDMKNAILLANSDLNDRYELVIEDEKCLGKDAALVANKLAHLDKVKYVIGFSCNQTILSAGPIYQREGIIAIAGFGTTGDVKGLGDTLFRLFPPDNFAIDKIYPFIASRYKNLGIITEQNEFPELLRRTFEKNFKANSKGYTLHQEEFQTGETDLKPMLLRLKARGVEALYIAANAEAGFIRAVKQLQEIQYKPAMYAAFNPGAQVVRTQVGQYIEGMVYVDLPGEDRLYSKSGHDVLTRFRERFGEPNSAPYSVIFGYETLRLLDEAMESEQGVLPYLRNTEFSSGVLGSYSFDDDGAVKGIGFELFQIKDGKIISFK